MQKLIIVVTVALVDFNSCIGDFLNQAMLIGYSPAPVTLQVFFERFGFAQAGKRITLNVFNQIKNLENKLLLAGLETAHFIQGGLHEFHLSHCEKLSFTYCLNSSIVKTVVRPACLSAIDASN